MNKLICIFVIGCFFVPLKALAEKDTILVIESYHAEYPWDKSYRKGIEKVLSPQKYNLVYFEMDTKRLPKPEHQKRADLAWDTYLTTKPELVILGDDNALKFLGPKFGSTKTPVVYLGINNNPRRYNVFKYDNITGVIERPLLKRSIFLINKILKPKPKNILVLFDNGTTSQASVEEHFEGKKRLTLFHCNVQLEMIGNRNEWETIVLNAKKNGFDALVIGLYHTVVDEHNKHVPANDLLKWTVENTLIPPFCFWDFSAGKDKAIGGFLLFGEPQGEKAGQLALEILNGKNPADTKLVHGEEGRLLYSTSQLKRWGIELPDKVIHEAIFID